MADHKKTVHDFDFIGRILTILKILQEQTDEFTTISQTEMLAQMEKRDRPCSARTLADYLKVMMKELNPEDEDGFVDDRFSISDYKIIPKGLKDIRRLCNKRTGQNNMFSRWIIFHKADLSKAWIV